MTKLLKIAFMAVSVVVSAVSVTQAKQDKDCDEVCKTFKQQQKAPPPKSVKIVKKGVRCLYVINSEPTAIVLRQNKGTEGKRITSWRKSVLKWEKYSGFWRTHICYKVVYDKKYKHKTLCGDQGHYWYGYKAKRDACIGGKKFCTEIFLSS